MRLKKDGTLSSDDFDVVVNRTAPEIDECKILLLKIISQAVEDFRSFKNKTKPEHVEIFKSAQAFLFDPAHVIDWGDHTISLDDISSLLGLDVVWMRSKISILLGIKLSPDGVVAPIDPVEK